MLLFSTQGKGLPKCILIAMTKIAIIYLVVINIRTFAAYGIDKRKRSIIGGAYEMTFIYVRSSSD
jgi:hypothetical protein